MSGSASAFRSNRPDVGSGSISMEGLQPTRTSVSPSRTVALAILVALSYGFGSYIGFTLTPSHDPIATFWPPNAIFLAALLLSPKRMWLPFLVAVLPAHILVQLNSGVPLISSFGWYLGNTGEALIGATLVRKFSKSESLFDSVDGLIAFLVFGVVVAPLVTSFWDAAVVITSGLSRGYWIHWTTRQFSNMLAILTLVPTIAIGWSDLLKWIRKASWTQYAEAGILIIGTVSIGLFVFGAESAPHLTAPALLYLPFPFLLWACLRFGLGGLSASLLAISLTSIWNAMQGRGPFASASMAENILSLQVCLCTIAIPLMLLAAVIQERRLAVEDLRRATARIINEQEQTSQRIARELHDGVGHQLVMVQMELDEIRDHSDPLLKNKLDKLYDGISDAADTAREISYGLHPARLEHLGLAAAVKILGSEISTAKSLHVQFEEGELPEQVPYNVSLCLYRVAQEALQNIAKHSHAHNVSIDLRQEGQKLMLKIADDGVGFTPKRVPLGLGVSNMRERVRSVGGTIEITSVLKGGTRINAAIPLFLSSARQEFPPAPSRQ